MNLATLLCLLTGQRCQTIHKIDANYIQLESDRCIITIPKVLKHTKAGNHQAPLVLKAYPSDKPICVLAYLQEYIKQTADLRGDNRSYWLALLSHTKLLPRILLLDGSKQYLNFTILIQRNFLPIVLALPQCPV